MTNSEYENACITAAAEPCHTYGLNKLASYDSKIAEVEKTLAGLQEGRREVINRYDLNKAVAVVDTTPGQVMAMALAAKEGKHDNGCEYVLCGGKCYCFR